MLNEKFIEEVFELCKKHKQNIEMTIDDFSNREKFNIIVNGAWPIKKEYDAVEVYKVSLDDECVMTIKGDGKVEDGKKE